MADKETQALKRLVKKLSALRATLRRDERALLDELILGSAAEVQAHGMTDAAAKTKTTPKVAEVAAHGMTDAAAKTKTTPKVAEVAAHGMTDAAAKTKTTPKVAEVAAHGMTDAAAKTKTTPKVAARVALRSVNEMIEFDAKDKAYKVKDR